MSVLTYKFKSPAILHKGFRAYLGLHGTAYEMFMQRKSDAQEFSTTKFDGLTKRGVQLEEGVQTLFSNTPKFVRRATLCGAATSAGLLPKRRVKALEAELETLQAELKNLAKKAKPTVKAAAKTVKKTVAKKAAVKAPVKIARHIKYFETVKTYDAAASEAVVKKIVNHLGIALNSRDASLVACSDESELNTVRASWMVKKLGLTADASILDAKIKTVCETMKADRNKCRVTFYYLLAKNENLLGAL